MAVSRFGYASINVTNIEAVEKHYTDVVGLRVTDRQGDKIYLQAMENQDHHCLILNPSDRACLDHFAFKVNDPNDLEEAESACVAWGLKTRFVEAGEIKGVGKSLAITLDSGQQLHLYYQIDKIGYAQGMENPSPAVPDGRKGGKVSHLDHILINSEHPQATADFFIEVLDFSNSENILGPDGSPLALFLSCGHTMHDVAIGGGPNNAFHHMAFAVDNRSDVIEGVDILMENHTPTLEYGLSRHGISGVTTVYYHDPSGIRNEFYNGAYLAAGAPGWVEPIIWPMTEFPRGGFYYESAIPETFFGEVT